MWPPRHAAPQGPIPELIAESANHRSGPSQPNLPPRCELDCFPVHLYNASQLISAVCITINPIARRFSGTRTRQNQSDFLSDDRRSTEPHYPTRPVDRDKAEAELTLNIKKATSPEETAPKQKHVRSKQTPILPRFPLTVRQNASSIRGTTTRPCPFGLGCVSSPSCPTRSRHSRRSLPCTRFSRKVTQ